MSKYKIVGSMPNCEFSRERAIEIYGLDRDACRLCSGIETKKKHNQLKKNK